jgi:hypothetical protein
MEGDEGDMQGDFQQALAGRLEGGKLGCAQAHALAAEYGLEPLAVGRAADEAGVRVFRCQLGLFGFGPKSEGKHKIVQPMANVPGETADRLRAAAGPEGISCLEVWRIASDVGMTRLEAAGAVEALGLRVSTCQLGCFPRP